MPQDVVFKPEARRCIRQEERAVSLKLQRGGMYVAPNRLCRQDGTMAVAAAAAAERAAQLQNLTRSPAFYNYLAVP